MMVDPPEPDWDHEQVQEPLQHVDTTSLQSFTRSQCPQMLIIISHEPFFLLPPPPLHKTTLVPLSRT